ncbi:sulfatase family protein [Mesorhizobium neociceri]|uniref:Sulfatase-like hydrolase/transferase n=1 Tax=Mesorhizobium neociceri TaxID=1307853 RepID=A0A838B8B1_9HYPH|nr:sulfatase-like hydrolase/transferase [Mesorhizobium neociceri]MBA1142327.1 sulfatase-like hydrolase/transferase [Mesorhizobium neociceri]
MSAFNILWVCSDQQRWDTLQCLGFKGTSTPSIDRLAAMGTVFRRAYCQSPICTPSRTSFLTGSYPIAHQVHQNGAGAFPPHLVLLPKLMADAGYYTGHIGKLHLSATRGMIEKRPDDGYAEFYWSPEPLPEWSGNHDYHAWMWSKGVDPEAYYKPYLDQHYGPGPAAEYRQTRWAGDRAERFIQMHAARSWYLAINIDAPHPPFNPPIEYLQRFNPADMPDPAFKPVDLEHNKKFARVDQQAKCAVDPWRAATEDGERGHNESAGPTHEAPPTSFNIWKMRAAYHAEVAQVDDLVGRILDALTETRQLDRTIIVFTSDHGDMMGDHGLLYKGCRFYEGVVHVPLVIYVPGNPAGAKSNALVELVDLAPTLLTLTGLEVPKSMQGLSLDQMLLGKRSLEKHKPFVVSEYYNSLRFRGSQGSRASMYFDGRYKLNVYHDAGIGELFDHNTDTNEHYDLWDSSDHIELKAEILLNSFSAMMVRSGAGPERIQDY